MGLFDPPYVKMTKYAPVSVQPLLAAVRIYAEDNVPADLSVAHRAMLVAMAMGGWISTNAQTGAFEMSKRGLDQVQLLYSNCAKLLSKNVVLIGPIMLGLCDAGLLPEAVRDFYSVG